MSKLDPLWQNFLDPRIIGPHVNEPIFWPIPRFSYLKYQQVFVLWLSLSDIEHGWAHGSNTVYSVIHGLTGTSIEL